MEASSFHVGPLEQPLQVDERRWLARHHKSKSELLVGYYKVDSGKPSMTWTESVDQALCYGWIDGIRRRIDDASYCIRFTTAEARQQVE